MTDLTKQQVYELEKARAALGVMTAAHMGGNDDTYATVFKAYSVLGNYLSALSYGQEAVANTKDVADAFIHGTPALGSDACVKVESDGTARYFFLRNGEKPDKSKNRIATFSGTTLVVLTPHGVPMDSEIASHLNAIFRAWGLVESVRQVAPGVSSSEWTIGHVKWVPGNTYTYKVMRRQ